MDIKQRLVIMLDELDTDQPLAYSYIRFSTPDQIKGDSLRRQLELSDRWCTDKNVKLDTSLTIRDLGVSAFDGSNIDKGGLGVFLKAIKKGRIKRGSYLLVESLDRLSRAQVMKAFRLFMNILEEGITIVTLADNMVYSEESVNDNFGQLIISLTIMSRAHEESRMKSQRVGAVWQSKRANAGKKKLTPVCPSWLKYDKTKDAFIVIKEKDAIVKQVFQMYLSGQGGYSIAGELNKKGIPPIGRAKQWSAQYIIKILKNRSVIGEFQPHRMNEGKRIPDGDVLIDYFPSVITEDVFYKAQSIFESRNANGRQGAGRKGKNIANIFRGLLRCPYCGGTITLGSTRTDKISYLKCRNKAVGRDCPSRYWRYDKFEDAVLLYAQGLDFNEVLNNQDDSLQVNLSTQLTVKQGELKDVSSKLKKLQDAFFDAEAVPSSFMDKALELEKEQALLKDIVNNLKTQLHSIKHVDLRLLNDRDDLVELYETMGRATQDKVKLIRSKLSQMMSEMLNHIWLFSNGDIRKKSITSHPFMRIDLKNKAHHYIQIQDDDISNPNVDMSGDLPEPKFEDEYRATGGKSAIE